MEYIKNANLEKGFTLVELLISLAILGIIVLALTAVLHTASQSNQIITTDMNQVKQARKAIDAVMDEIHYSQGIVAVDPTGTSITYTDFNGTSNTILAYNTTTKVLTLRRGVAGIPIAITNGNVLQNFTIKQVLDANNQNAYIFTMCFRYNPNDPTKDLNVTTRVKPFTYQ
jgi:prepilin-type N-terminal cleavage/methylation domain-containing protein